MVPDLWQDVAEGKKQSSYTMSLRTGSIKESLTNVTHCVMTEQSCILPVTFTDGLLLHMSKHILDLQNIALLCYILLSDRASLTCLSFVLF